MASNKVAEYARKMREKKLAEVGTPIKAPMGPKLNLIWLVSVRCDSKRWVFCFSCSRGIAGSFLFFPVYGAAVAAQGRAGHECAFVFSDETTDISVGEWSRLSTRGWQIPSAGCHRPCTFVS